MRGKRIIGISLSVMLMTVTVASPVRGFTKEQVKPRDVAASQTANEANDIDPEEGTYVPNQVIIEYQKSLLKVKKGTKARLSKVRNSKHASKKFGMAMQATKGSEDAATTYLAQTSILSKCLGEDFTIEDTLCIGEKGDFVYSLVSSDKYSTKEMMQILRSHEEILAVSPNGHIKACSEEDSAPAYSLNDEYAGELYHQNNPTTKNTSGHSTTTHGFDLSEVESQNLSYAWDRSEFNSSAEPEVVAVVDSGVYAQHEDLQDNMWVNPGTIGLNGDYGYDFYKNSETVIDEEGHGTHCAGVIAARSGNKVGVAGATANTAKIMGLRIFGPKGEMGDYMRAISAFAYIIKAKEQGVNIHYVNNSWGASRSFCGETLKDIIEKMYDLGITLFFAADNSNRDNDLHNTEPCNSEAKNVLSVGSCNEDGTRSEFSSWGSESVDFFTPGKNILSTYAADTYFPCLYDTDRLALTTEYYGEYSADMIGKSGYDATPTTGDDNNRKSNASVVKSFGKPRFYARDGINLEMSVIKEDTYGNSEKPATLSIQIKGAKKGDSCYVWFPYKKNPNSDGSNTYYCIMYNNMAEKSNSEWRAVPGEIVQSKDKSVKVHKADFANPFSDLNDRMWRRAESNTLMSYDASGKETIDSYGLGFRIDVTSAPDKDGVLTMGLNSLAVSKPNVSKADFGKYEIKTGTSMASPAAVGFAAVLSRLAPEGSAAAGGKKGKKYVDFIRSKLFSLTTHSEKLEGLCRTEGYLDFSRLDDPSPTIETMKVNTSKKTITLTGTGLGNAAKLSYRRLVGSNSKTEIPFIKSGTGPYAVKNSNGSVTLKNAGGLIGTYTRFYVETDGLTGTSAAFLVNGEKKFSGVKLKADASSRYLITDKKGSKVYSISFGEDDEDVSNLTRLNSSSGKFVDVHKKSFYKQLKSYLNKQGLIPESFKYDKNLVMSLSFLTNQVMCSKGLYRNILLVKMDSQYCYVLTTIDVNAKNPKWKFKVLKSVPKILGTTSYVAAFGMIGKYIYSFGGLPEKGEDDHSLSRHIYRLDTSTGKWKKMSATLPLDMFQYNAITYDGSIYLMAGTAFSPEAHDFERDPAIYKYDGKKFTRMKAQFKTDFRGTSFVSEIEDNYNNYIPTVCPALAPTKNGILIHGISIDGYGNTILYNPKKDKITPVYATVESGLCAGEMNAAVMTKKGLYVGRMRMNVGWIDYLSRYFFLKPGKDTFTLPKSY